MEGLAALLVGACLLGLSGAPHCIGMCGGTVSAVALQADGQPLAAMLRYNAGRGLTYMLLGGVMGAIGSVTALAGKLVGVQGAAAMLGGALMLLWAFMKRGWPLGPQRWQRLHTWAQGARQGEGAPGEKAAFGGRSAFGLGLAMGWLPCGLTYAMQMQAAATGSWWKGAAVMGVFAVATTPALLLAGAASLRLGRTLRRRLRFMGEWLLLAMGVLSILKGLAANGWIPSLHPWLW